MVPRKRVVAGSTSKKVSSEATERRLSPPSASRIASNGGAADRVHGLERLQPLFRLRDRRSAPGARVRLRGWPRARHRRRSAVPPARDPRNWSGRAGSRRARRRPPPRRGATPRARSRRRHRLAPGRRCAATPDRTRPGRRWAGRRSAVPSRAPHPLQALRPHPARGSARARGAAVRRSPARSRPPGAPAPPDESRAGKCRQSPPRRRSRTPGPGCRPAPRAGSPPRPPPRTAARGSPRRLARSPPWPPCARRRGCSRCRAAAAPGRCRRHRTAPSGPHPACPGRAPRPARTAAAATRPGPRAAVRLGRLRLFLRRRYPVGCAGRQSEQQTESRCDQASVHARLVHLHSLPRQGGRSRRRAPTDCAWAT